MSYAKFHDAYWDGEKIAPLSDRACLLGAFLITGKHRNAIGCFRLGIGAITDETRFGKWGTEGVSKALQEMVETGFIVRDQATGWTLITNYLNKDPIKGSKAAIHAANLAHQVPVGSPVYQRLREVLEPQLREEEKALSKVEGWPMRAPSDGASKGDGNPKRSPNPIPGPIPPPAPEPIPGPGAAAAPPVATRMRGSRLPQDWQPGTELRAWAAAKRPDLALGDVIENFRDYWHAQPGQRGVKLDWDATFRRWVREQKRPPGAGGFVGSGPLAPPPPRPTMTAEAASASVHDAVDHAARPPAPIQAKPGESAAGDLLHIPPFLQRTK